MRNSLRLGLLIWLLVGISAPAGADTLDFVGNLSLGIGTLPAIDLPSQGGGSLTATLGGASGVHLSTVVVPASTFATEQLTVPVDSVTIMALIALDIANQQGTFTGLSDGPPAGGAMGLSGTIRICALVLPAACPFLGIEVPLATPSGNIGLGIGGTQFVTEGGLRLTLEHAPWTLGQAGAFTVHDSDTAVTTPLATGFAHGPASGTSTTGQPGGAVQLVTVSKVQTSLASAFPQLAVSGTLTLQFVPEPGTLLLLGSGVAALGLGVQRRRS